MRIGMMKVFIITLSKLKATIIIVVIRMVVPVAHGVIQQTKVKNGIYAQLINTRSAIMNSLKLKKNAASVHFSGNIRIKVEKIQG